MPHDFTSLSPRLLAFDCPQLVQDFLEKKRERLGSKVALVCGNKRYTYRELDDWSNRVAHGLIARGAKKDDRVCICLQNSVEFVVAIFAVLKAGAVFVPIHPSTKKDKLEYIVHNCEATVLIAEARNHTTAGLLEARNASPSLSAVFLCGKFETDGNHGNAFIQGFNSLAEDQSSVPLPRINSEEDLACLIYTSGSTGEPKGVMSNHGNVIFAASSIASYLENRESDVVLNVLPLSFDYGLYQLFMSFLFGGTLVLEKSFTFPAAILNLVAKENVSGFPGVPTIFSMLLKLDLSKFNLSSIRYLTNTAAAIPQSHIQAIRKTFPNAQLHSMYGLTETKRTLHLPPALLETFPGSVGIPIPGTDAWLVGENGERLSNGQTGELVARGRHVMQGYWREPILSSRRFRRGKTPDENCCYTGDLFRTDDAGLFYFVGRQDDIIKSRGEKVAPKEVENVLYALDGIMHVAVVGVSDPVLGQAIKAFVSLSDPSLTKRSILAHCKKNLEDIMVPKFIEIRDELPKTNTGKIDKKLLS